MSWNAAPMLKLRLKMVTLRLVESGRNPTTPVATAPKAKKSIPAPRRRVLTEPPCRNETREIDET